MDGHTPYRCHRRTSCLFVCSSFLGDFIVAIVQQSGRRIVTLYCRHSFHLQHTNRRPLAHVSLLLSYMRKMTNNKRCARAAAYHSPYDIVHNDAVLCRSRCMHSALFFICFYYFNLSPTHNNAHAHPLHTTHRTPEHRNPTCWAHTFEQQRQRFPCTFPLHLYSIFSFWLLGLFSGTSWVKSGG